MRHDREYRILLRSPSLTHFEFWKYLRPCQNSCSLVVRLRSVFLAAYTSNRALQHSGFEDFRYKMQTCMHGPCHHCLPAAPWGCNQTIFNIASHVRLHSGTMMSKTFDKVCDDEVREIEWTFHMMNLNTKFIRRIGIGGDLTYVNLVIF